MSPPFSTIAPAFAPSILADQSTELGYIGGRRRTNAPKTSAFEILSPHNPCWLINLLGNRPKAAGGFESACRLSAGQRQFLGDSRSA
jgi:hypothetical protein